MGTCMGIGKIMGMGMVGQRELERQWVRPCGDAAAAADADAVRQRIRSLPCSQASQGVVDFTNDVLNNIVSLTGDAHQSRIAQDMRHAVPRCR